jgi:SHS family lactate transporter-like MFS transporter
MENWPERSKKIVSGVLQGSWAIGFLLANEVAGLVVPSLGWRAVFVIAAVPALLVIPIRMFVPESPEWERRRGERRARSSWRELVSPSVLRTLAWSSVIMALGFGVYYGLGANYPLMLATEHGMDVAARTELIRLFYVGMLVGAIACGWLFQRRGLLAAVVLPALAVVPVLPLYVGAVPQLLGVGAFLGGALGVGFCGIAPALLTSIFPAHIRGRAVGLVYHVGAFLTAFVPTAVPALAAATGLSLGAVIGLLAGGFEILLALALLLRPRPEAAEPLSPTSRVAACAASRAATPQPSPSS